MALFHFSAKNVVIYTWNKNSEFNIKMNMFNFTVKETQI